MSERLVSNSPFVGLRPYYEEEANLFFGRNTEIETVTTELLTHKILFLTGPVASGKTSLIQAGLIPKLKKGDTLISKDFDWKVCSFAPRDNPLNQFTHSLCSIFQKEEPKSLLNKISKDSGYVIHLFKKLLKELPKTALFIFLDQFEEFFTYPENDTLGESHKNVSKTVQILLETHEIAVKEDLPIFILFNNTTEYIPHCATLDGLGNLCRKHHYQLPNPGNAAVHEIIDKPIQLANTTITQRLKDKILSDLGETMNVLPVLQYALWRTWDFGHTDGQQIDLLHYAKTGGVKVMDLPLEEQETFRNWFKPLPGYKRKNFENTGILSLINHHLSEIIEEACANFISNINLPQQPNERAVSLNYEQINHVIKCAFICTTRVQDHQPVKKATNLRQICEMAAIPGLDYKMVSLILSPLCIPKNNIFCFYSSSGKKLNLGGDIKHFELPEDSIIDLASIVLVNYWSQLSTWVWEDYENIRDYFNLEENYFNWSTQGKNKEFLLSYSQILYFEKLFLVNQPSPAWVKRCMIENADKVGKTTVIMGKKIRLDDEKGNPEITELPNEQSPNLKGVDYNPQARIKVIEDFIKLSRKNYNFKRRLNKVSLIVISVLLVIAVFAFLDANVQKKKVTLAHKLSKSNELAYLSFLTSEKDPTIAYRLAESAYNINPGGFANQALIGAYTQPPYYKLLRGHNNIVKLAYFSDDGKFVLSASHDKTVRMWDVKGEEIKKFIGHTDVINSLQISKDGKLGLTASDDKSIRIWHLETGKADTLLGHLDKVITASFSPDEKNILSASWDSTLRLWDTNGKLLHVFKQHQDRITCATFTRSGKEIISGGADNQIILWSQNGEKFKVLEGHQGNIVKIVTHQSHPYFLSISDDFTAILWDSTGKKIATMQGHQAPIIDANFSPDGKKIVTVGADFNFILWEIDYNNGVLDATFSKKVKAHNAKILMVSFSPHGEYFVTSSEDNTAKIWSLKGNLVQTLKTNDFFYSTQFSPEGRYVVTTHNNGSLRLWDIHNYESMSLQGHSQYVWQAIYSPNGKYILTSSWDNTAILWNNEGKLLHRLVGHTDIITGAVFAVDGFSFFTSSADNTLRNWNLDGKCIQVLYGHRAKVYKPDVSSDGKFLISPSEDKSAILWKLNQTDTGTYAKIHKVLTGHTSRIYTAKFSTDGHYILTGSRDNTARLYSQTGKTINILKGHTAEVYCVKFSNSGKYFATGSSDGSARLYDHEGNFLQIFKGHTDGINDLCFSKDDLYLATASGDNTVRIWNMSGKSSAVMSGHTLMVNTVEFSPNGKLLLSSSDDMTARVWNLNGVEMLVLKGHSGGVQSATFSPNGKNIVTASQDKTARIWPAGLEEVFLQINEKKSRGNFWTFDKNDRKHYDLND